MVWKHVLSGGKRVAHELVQLDDGKGVQFSFGHFAVELCRQEGR